MVHTHISFRLLIGAVAVTITTLAATRLTADVISDCVGKPYGSPGCPTQAQPQTSSSSSVAGTCGNAIVNPGEECDKGRFNGQSECSIDCKELYCGDGRISPQTPDREECEPETEEVYAIDPVSGKLVTEKHFKKSGDQCGSYCLPPVCDEDGSCSGGCKWSFVSVCSSSSASSTSISAAAAVAGSSASVSAATPPPPAVSAPPAAPSSVAPAPPAPVPAPVAAVCGNGLTDPGEECDDANKVDNDNCTDACRYPRCGDGIQQAFEECDDGNRVPNDDCSLTCRQAKCGDAIVHALEDCDDGNKVDNDNCSNACRSGRCGDGIVQRDEECDDGNGNEDDACSSLCRTAKCGDGKVQLGEQCDDGNRANNDSCSNECRVARCGDGIVQEGEQCDSAAGNSDTLSNRCRLTCRFPRCGDGVVDQGEQCDGGENCQQCRVAVGVQTHGSAPDAMTADSGASDMRIIVAALIGFVGVASVVTSFALRRRIARAILAKPKSIDDIPLDQIEMPWHKW